MPRHNQTTCTCRAYTFPHRFNSGKCTGKPIVYQQWDDGAGVWSGGECATCHCLDETEAVPRCQVIEGRESVAHCPAWAEYVLSNEIRIRPNLRKYL